MGFVSWLHYNDMNGKKPLLWFGPGLSVHHQVCVSWSWKVVRGVECLLVSEVVRDSSLSFPFLQNWSTRSTSGAWLRSASARLAERRRRFGACSWGRCGHWSTCWPEGCTPSTGTKPGPYSGYSWFTVVVLIFTSCAEWLDCINNLFTTTPMVSKCHRLYHSSKLKWWVFRILHGTLKL